jgi:hypothetical protein
MNGALRMWALVVVGVAVLGGCGAGRPPLTQTQLDAIQVRVVEASPDRAFGAATSALLDGGYQVFVSDGDSGFLTGEKRKDPAVGLNILEIVVTTLARAPQDLPPDFYAVSIQVLPETGGRAKVRIRPFDNGIASDCTDPDGDGRKVVEELWALMQRQVLMKEPSRAVPPK